MSDLLKSILPLSKKQFEKRLEELEESQIQDLYDSFRGLEEVAQSKAEKALIKRHRKTFTSARRKRLHPRSRKLFLTKHLKLLKRVIAAFLQCVLCIKLAASLCNGENVVCHKR